MEGKHTSLLNQLSGLRLSDGSVVGARVSSGNTPPTLSAYSSRSTPAASPTGFPAASLSSDAATSAPAGSTPPPPPPPATRRAARATKKDADAAAPTSSVTDKINRLLAQNKGSLANSGAAAASVPSDNAHDGKSASLITSLAAQMGRTPSPSSSTGAASSPASSTPPATGKSAAAAAPSAAAAAPTATSTTANASAAPAAPAASAAPAPRTAVAVPKPRSVEAAAVVPKTSAAVVVPAEQLAPTVMDFFSKAAVASRSPPPLAEQTAVLKTAVVIAEAPANGKAAASSSNATTTTTNSRKERERAAAQAPAPVGGNGARSAPAARPAKEQTDPANKFLADAFGSIDNLDVTKPIIRTAPQISSAGRYIIVGDLHGCVDQLEQLVEKVKYVKGTDCLLIIGDYVNKGPDSIGVVRACQRLGAYGVLGNHDYTLLRCCARMRRRPFTPDDLRDPVKRLAQKFPKDCEYYLRGLPHMIRIPRHNVLLVHAGLNLQHTLENQNVEEVMHLRRLEAMANKPGAYRAIAKGMEGEPWAKLWSGPEMVVFGHDAYAGFQSHPYACGIDTGCVYGDPLTCVVFGQDSPAGDFFSVSGLPKLENEMKGLPPPSSDIYEQDDIDLAKLIIRPTSRATPALLGGSLNGRPVFLAAPLGYTGAEGEEAGNGTAANATAGATTAPSVKASALTATVTSTNTLMSPSSPTPSRLVTPTCAVNVRFMETATVNTREVMRATLLALSATRELSAIAVLLAVPLYAQEVDAMVEAEGSDKVTQEAFWVPFARLVLAAAAEMNKSGTPVSSPAVAEPAVQLALDVCEEMESVCNALQAELKALLAAERESPAWPKRIVKCAATLVA